MKDLKSKLMAEMGDSSPMAMSEKDIKMQILKQLHAEMERMMNDNGDEDLREHRAEASGMMIDGPLGPKLSENKISVEAEDPADLEKGLNKAKELISQSELDEYDDEDDEEDED